MSDQITITLSKEQCDGIEHLEDAIVDIANKIEFLSEIVEQQFDKGHGFSEGSWLGLSAILKDIWGTSWREADFLRNLVKLLPEKEKATATGPA